MFQAIESTPADADLIDDDEPLVGQDHPGLRGNSNNLSFPHIQGRQIRERQKTRNNSFLEWETNKEEFFLRALVFQKTGSRKLQPSPAASSAPVLESFNGCC